MVGICARGERRGGDWRCRRKLKLLTLTWLLDPEHLIRPTGLEVLGGKRKAFAFGRHPVAIGKAMTREWPNWQ